MKNHSTLFAVIAVLLMFFGFGMIMWGGSAAIVWLSRTGSVMLGIGSIYLIFRLIQSMQKEKQENRYQ